MIKLGYFNLQIYNIDSQNKVNEKNQILSFYFDTNEIKGIKNNTPKLALLNKKSILKLRIRIAFYFLEFDKFK